MDGKMQKLRTAAVSIAIATAVVFAGSASAQTPPTSPTSTVNPKPTPDPSRPAPTFDSGPLVINVTLKLATSADGLVQDIPAGTKLQVVSGGGVCTEMPLPADAAQTIATAGALRLPPLDVPTKAAAEAKGVGVCPAPGEALTIVLALPGGSTISLLTTIWSAGTAFVDLTVTAPQPQSEAPSGLPSTGDRATGTRTRGPVFAGLVLVLAFGAAAAAVAVKRRA